MQRLERYDLIDKGTRCLTLPCDRLDGGYDRSNVIFLLERADSCRSQETSPEEYETGMLLVRDSPHGGESTQPTRCR